MTTPNVQNLMNYIATLNVGDVIEIATSEYADNTTPLGHRFDWYTTAPAVISLIKQGYIAGENRWRYYECTVVKLPPMESVLSGGGDSQKHLPVMLRNQAE